MWDDGLRRRALGALNHIEIFPMRGLISKAMGPMLEVTGLKVQTGQVCDVHCASGRSIEAEVVGFRDEHALLMPVGAIRGIALGDPVLPRKGAAQVHVSDALLGRVLDAQGLPLDDKPQPVGGEPRPLHGQPLNPMGRHIIDKPMQLGVRVLDACLTMGWGQRLGLFAGPGVGKSVLLGMLARHSDADVNVIALVGERGREVREFLDRALGSDALKRCVVIVATADMPPVLRIRAALMATTISEHFRDQGKKVLLMMDSLTRFVQAQREIGLMLGEPPASKGYTPSCFSALAELLERTGPGENEGDISALYTVLVEGDDLSDPVADAAMSVLDGHVLLERSLAERGHFPAISLLKSVSRLANELQSESVNKAARSLRKEMALFGRMEDMVNMGAYQKGTNPELDRVIQRLPAIQAFLQQAPQEHSSLGQSNDRLIELMGAL